MEQETGQWLECKVDKDYEIWSEYPYPLRRKNSKRICKEWINNRDYVCCWISGKHWLKHRILAIQFLPNPNSFSQVDHINHDRSDNRIENLRWTSQQDNMRNKSGHMGYRYVFLEELPPTTQLLESYNEHEFDNLFVDYIQHKLYVFNGIVYRELIPCTDRGSICYWTYDTDHKWCHISHNKLFTNEEEEED